MLNISPFNYLFKYFLFNFSMWSILPIFCPDDVYVNIRNVGNKLVSMFASTSPGTYETYSLLIQLGQGIITIFDNKPQYSTAIPKCVFRAKFLYSNTFLVLNRTICRFSFHTFSLRLEIRFVTISH